MRFTRPPAPVARPQVELLEDRVVPAIRTWTGLSTTGSTWADAANWNLVGGSQVPIAGGDHLEFPPNAFRKTGQIVNVPIGTFFPSVTYTGTGYNVLSSNTIAVGKLTPQYFSGSNTFNSGIRLQGNPEVQLFAFPGSTFVINGVVSGSGVLTKDGTGTLVLGGANANTYTGLTKVVGGTLVLKKGGALGSTATGTFLGPAGILQLASDNFFGGVNVGAEELFLGTELVSSSNFDSWAGKIRPDIGNVIRVNGLQLTVTGTLTPQAVNGSITKEGPGLLFLQGDNLTNQTTVVNAGTLLVNGSQPDSPVTVNAGGTVGGTGTLGAGVTLVGGRLDPGSVQTGVALGAPFAFPRPGILRAEGAVSFDAASTFRVQLEGTTAGSGHDRLTVTGTVALNNATLDVLSITSQSVVGNTYRVISNDGLDPVVGTFNGLPEGAVFTTSSGVKLRVSYKGGGLAGVPLSGNDVTLRHVNSGTTAQDLQLSPAEVDEGGEVTLTGRLTDPDLRDRLTLQIDWGDGSRPQTFHPGRDDFQITHRYRDDPEGPDDRYVVRVTWFDEHGEGNSRDLEVTVRNVSPEVDAGPSVALKKGGGLTRKGSFADPGEDDWVGTVDYGDGSDPEELRIKKGQSFVLHHRYREAGEYLVKVTVSDDGEEGTDSFLVTVAPKSGGHRAGAADSVDAYFASLQDVAGELDDLSTPKGRRSRRGG